MAAARTSRPADPRRPRWTRLNTGGLLYGTIVSASALALGAGRRDSAADMASAMAATLVIYWLAHVYITTVSEYRAGTASSLRHRAGHAAGHEAPILLGGLPALTVVVIETLVGVNLWVIVLSGVGSAIVMLALGGFLVGLNAGGRGWRLAADTTGAALFGGLIASLLVWLHVH